MKKVLLGKLFLMLMLTSSLTFAQERVVTGKVTSSEDGSPLPGVSVLQKGTANGTVTDTEGKYSLLLNVGSQTLIFSFVGMKSSEVEIGEMTSVDISLGIDVTQLSEVVVTALGVERQAKALGFSAKEIKNNELTVARTTNVVNALSGKIAGVRVAGSNGMTGSSSAIFIRGFTTFTGSNQPLFVVDGIPINNDGGANALQTGVSNSNRAIDINQDDIESMTVLKGPAAAVLYGSRAAAGAIIITTKKGKSTGGKSTVVEYTGSYNINEPNRLPDYQNRYAQGTSISSTGANVAPIYQPNADQSNWGPEIQGQSVPSSYSPAVRALLGLPETVSLTAYPNNVRDLFRTGANQQHNLAFSGGNDKGNFFLSVNNLRDKGFLENNNLERNSFRFTGNMKMTEKFTAGVSINYINSNSNRSQIGNQLSNPLFRGWFLPRNYNLQGDPSQLPDGSQVYFNANTDNPYWTLRNNLYNDVVNRVIGNFNLGYKVNDWMKINYKLGTDFYIQQEKRYDAIGARGAGNNGSTFVGVGSIGDQFISNQETSSYLNLQFEKKVNDFNLSLLMGNEINLRVGAGNGFISSNLQTRGFDNPADALNYVPIPIENSRGNYRTRRNLVGIYADFQANYKEWAYVGITGRNDWSSTFTKGKNSYFYPSITTSFIISEAFPKIKGNIVNFGKIKANWAKVGREAPIYSTDTYYTTANPSDGFGPQFLFPFLGNNGRTLENSAGNPDLRPEFTRSWEVGTEWSLLNDRISVDLTYFNTRSTDIILNVPIAAASGFSSIAQNAGVLETNGIELGLGFVPVKTSNFKWSIDINWSRIRNNVISLAPGVANIPLAGFGTAQTRIEADRPYGVIYAQTLLKNASGEIIVNPTTGLPSIDASGIKYVGNPNPNWTGGLTNTFNYKGLTFSVLFDFRNGGDILSRVINDVRRTGTAAETAEFDRFDANGRPTLNYIVPGVFADGTPNNVPVSAQQYWSNMYSFNVPGMGVFDASWTRVREASIFYSLPKAWLAKTPFGRVEIGMNGRNLFLWTKVPHIDPETNLSGATNSQGLEFNTMPNARSYGAVLKLTF
jgi:TonB-linked SusC/RagA family outer membrane protein